jgi:hypothetical protein
MRKRFAGGAVLGLGGVVLSLALGQAPQPQPKAPGAAPPGPPAPPRPLPADLLQTNFVPPAASAAVAPPGRDLSKLPPLVQQMHLTARRGGEWLFRAHLPTGRFLAGWRPALNQPADDDPFLRQAGAALALARAARYFQDERYAARARQAVLTLLAETGADARDPHARCTTLPSSVVNRLGAAGLLLAAIHELPAPADDLLMQGEQVAKFIFNQQRPDGSLSYADGPEVAADPDGVNHYPGWALYGLMRSQQARPHPWKAEFFRRSAAYYRPWWRDHKSPAFAASMAPACAEAYLASKERAKDAAAADFCFELCDYLCGLQYQTLDPQHPHWLGGFQPVAQGKPVAEMPRAADAASITALVEGCRVTRQVPDLERYPRYKDAAQRGAQFLATLQYTESNTQHFAAEYRAKYLVGGFHASPADGDLRLDDTRHAVAALVQYLATVPDA